MKHLLSLSLGFVSLITPQFLLAAQIGFSVSPNNVIGDNAVIIDVSLTPQDGESINAIEGRIGILGEGRDSVTDVVIETGDSLFSFWPVPPAYNKEEKIIRFTGGAPDSLTEQGMVFRLRIFSKSETPISLSWLGGFAYQDDGQGTPIGISSRSISFTPKSGPPNQIRATSEDVKPPVISIVEIANDEETFDGQYFLSIHAIDDSSGVSHYEVIENGEVVSFENGPYLIRDQTLDQPLHITVYDKAGNSISIKYPDNNSFNLVTYIALASIILIAVISFRYFRKYF